MSDVVLAKADGWGIAAGVFPNTQVGQVFEVGQDA
jgi:hypothetical protein